MPTHHTHIIAIDNLKSPELFWIDWVNGLTTLPYQTCPAQKAYTEYLTWCEANNERYPFNQSLFSSVITAFADEQGYPLKRQTAQLRQPDQSLKTTRVLEVSETPPLILPIPLTGQRRLAIANTYRVCAGEIIDIASASLTGDGMSSRLSTLVDDILGRMGDIDPSLEPLRNVLEALEESDQDDTGTCIAALRDAGFTGYAIEFNTPAELQEDTDPVFDYCALQWIYAETIEEAWALAITWAKNHQQRLTEEA